MGLTGYLVDEQIPGRLLSFLTQLTRNKYLFLAGLNVFLLAVGCMMDIFSAIIIIVPIMVPIALTLWQSIPCICALFFWSTLRSVIQHPRWVSTCFISSLKFQKPVTTLYRASIPYLVLLLVSLILITYVPLFSLFLIR